MKLLSGYEHGINLGGWFSQCNHTQTRYEQFIKENDFARIRDWGLDHVRLPVDYELVQNRDGSLRHEGFRYLDRAIEWCSRYKLNMILDLHKACGYSFDQGEQETGFFENSVYQEYFYQLWEALAERYGHSGQSVSFELLNEVTDQAYSDQWNRIASECIHRIRHIAPDVWILVGGYWNNSIDSLADLKLPRDPHLVYNFHFYEPLIFTHQGAAWIPTMKQDFRISASASYAELQSASDAMLGYFPDRFSLCNPSSPLGPEYFEQAFAKAIRIAETENVPLYCGEYGVIQLARHEDILHWYRLFSGALNRLHIGRAAWSYKQMDFGISDPCMEDIRQALIACL